MNLNPVVLQNPLSPDRMVQTFNASVLIMDFDGTHKSSSFTFGNNIIQPAVWSVCRGSRDLALESYQSLLIPSNLITSTHGDIVVRVYINMRINWECDTLHYDCRTDVLAEFISIQIRRHLAIDIGYSYARFLRRSTPTATAWDRIVLIQLLPPHLSILRSVNFISGWADLREPRPRQNEWEEYSSYILVDADQNLLDLLGYLQNIITRDERHFFLPSNMEPVYYVCNQLEEIKTRDHICRESEVVKHSKRVNFSVALPAERIYGFWNQAAGWEVIYPVDLTESVFWPEDYDECNVVDGVLQHHGRRQICEQDGSLLEPLCGCESAVCR